MSMSMESVGDVSLFSPPMVVTQKRAKTSYGPIKVIGYMHIWLFDKYESL